MTAENSSLPPKVSKLATLAFVISLSAALFGIIGATPYPKMLLFPLSPPSGEWELPVASQKWSLPVGEWVYYAFAVYPMVGGAIGMLLGRVALWRICQAEVPQSGEARAVFASFIGLLAFCLGLVAVFVIYLWPRLEVTI
ncbi:MAG: hypothetical protein N2112_15365 [Gemmataceae bacterium]|jgi:hypothetical protein|nr:hypothetical protein [Gemmataceae bacterium]